MLAWIIIGLWLIFWACIISLVLLALEGIARWGDRLNERAAQDDWRHWREDDW